jgi:hypothetical protein
MEWSAPSHGELGDMTAWRAAAPHWSPRRERMVTAKYRAAITASASGDPIERDPVTSFQSQWLNIWPARTSPSLGRAEPLLEDGAWEALVDLTVGRPTASTVLAVEDH